jgi:hypothetical protein
MGRQDASANPPLEFRPPAPVMAVSSAVLPAMATGSGSSMHTTAAPDDADTLRARTRPLEEQFWAMRTLSVGRAPSTRSDEAEAVDPTRWLTGAAGQSGGLLTGVTATRTEVKPAVPAIFTEK